MADNIFDQLDFEHLIFREKRHRIEDTLSEHLVPLRDHDLYTYEPNIFVPSPTDGKAELSEDIEFGQSMQIEPKELVSGPSFYEPPMQMKDAPPELPPASPGEEGHEYVPQVKEEPSVTVETT